MPTSTSTITLQSVLDTVSPFIYNLPLTITQDGQPFLGMCNVVTQFITAPPLQWRWNRADVSFVTQAGVQDYAFLPNWSAGLAVVQGQKIIDSNNNGEVALNSGLTGSSAPTWPTTPNKGLYQTVTDNTGTEQITWQQIGPIGNIPSPLTNLGNPTACSIYDVGTNPVNTTKGFVQIDYKTELEQDSVQARPRFFSLQYDNLTGAVIIRFMPVPDKAYPVNITYQKAFVPYTELSQTWSIPDSMFYTYFQGVLELAYQYANDGRDRLANSKFVSGILAYQDGLTDFEKSIVLNNWTSLTTSELLRNQQGTQVRAT